MTRTREVGGAARTLFAIAGLLLVGYIVNIGLGMLVVKRGMSLWRLPDVGEFVLVVSAMAFFVAGLLTDEERTQDPEVDAGRGNSTQGGVQ